MLGNYADPLAYFSLLGIVLILAAVTLIVLGKSLSPAAVTRFVGHLDKEVVKHWRWK